MYCWRRRLRDRAPLEKCALDSRHRTDRRRITDPLPSNHSPGPGFVSPRKDRLSFFARLGNHFARDRFSAARVQMAVGRTGSIGNLGWHLNYFAKRGPDAGFCSSGGGFVWNNGVDCLSAKFRHFLETGGASNSTMVLRAINGFRRGLP